MIVKNTKLQREQIKKHAEELYVHHQRDFAYIAQVYKIPERTIRRWAKDNDWENTRKQVNESSWKTMQELKAALPKLIKKVADNPTAANADSLQKVVSSLKKLSKDVDLIGNALMILKEFSLYIKENDPDRAETLLDHIEPFIKHLETKHD